MRSVLSKMIRRRPWIGLVAAVVGVGTPWLFLSGQRSVCTAADAEKWMSDVRPLVERITGRKFVSLPRIELVGRPEMERVLYDDSVPEFKAVYFRYPLSMLHARVNAEASRILGTYIPRKRTIYLVPANLKALLRSRLLNERSRSELMKLVLAHEMVRCMQDQHVGIGRFLSHAGTNEERMAIRATFEGHARLVTEECAMAMGLAKTFGDLTCVWCEDSDEESRLGRAERANANGWRFMCWQRNYGGHPWLWKVLALPPASTSLFTHPERYPLWRKHTLSSAQTDYSGVLKGVEKHLGSGKWTVHTRRIGTDDIRTLYADVDPADAEVIALGTIYAQGMRATDRGAEISVWFAVEKRPELVKRMMMLDRQAHAAQMNRLRANGVKVSPTAYSSLEGIKAGCAVKGTDTIEGSGGRSTTVTAFVARGRIAVGVVVRDFRVTDAKIAEIAQAVYRSIAKVEAASVAASRDPSRAGDLGQ